MYSSLAKEYLFMKESPPPTFGPIFCIGYSNEPWSELHMEKHSLKHYAYLR